MYEKQKRMQLLSVRIWPGPVIEGPLESKQSELKTLVPSLINMENLFKLSGSKFRHL